MQLVLGVAGAGIGSMFGYASIGWSIGSFIGGQLFPSGGQDIKGPRLSDKSVSTSAYGNMRPVIYGAYRIGGEVIWSTDLKEHAHKEEAGKGGGGGSYTTYTYTVSFALALCKGPIIGVRKMWFDGKLVYSVADDATNAELQASEKLAKKLAFYVGNETQLADPTIEAELGAGNVPAYRGTAYIVFTNLDVTKYGSRIPQITVEVVASGATSLTGAQITSGGAAIRQSLSVYSGIVSAFNYTYTWDGTDASLGQFELRSYSLEDGSLKKTVTAYALAKGDESLGYRYLYPIGFSPRATFAIAEVGSVGTGNNSQYYLFSNSGGLLTPIDILPTGEDLDNYNNGTDRSYNLMWEDEYNLWFYKFNSGDIYHYEIVVTPLGDYYVEWTTFNVDDTRTDAYLGGAGSFCIDRASGELYVEIITDEATPVYSIKRYSRDGTLIESKFSTIDWRSYSARLISYSEGILYEVNGVTLKVYDWETETLLASSIIATDATHLHGAVMEASGNLCTVLAGGVVYNYSRNMTSTGAGLDDVVSDICTSAGMNVSDIDVTDLAADTVRGFMISQQGPARGALEQLSAAYFFDGRESDGVLEFIKRGDTPTVTLSDDDIGCYEGDDVQELADATRTQEEELPKALTLNYANVGADFQIGAQHSLRQSVLNGTEATVQLPIALNDTEGKTIVDTMMFAAWQNRHQFVLKTWQKYAKLEPADVISARGETLRIVNRSEGVNGIIELTTVRELPSIYTGQVGSGATSGHSSQTVDVNGPTDFRLLDIPPVRDNDYNNYGMYWAASGMLSGWPGAALFRSPDSGSTWGYEFAHDVASVMGNTDTALGDFTGGNIFDETNVLRVYVVGTLETKTETEVLNGANIAMVGDEMIQFKNATLVTTGVYDLSGFLRGRMGTEWAIDAHSNYEDFTLISSTATRFIDVPYTDLNVTLDWGCVTFGDTLEDIVPLKVSYTGENMKPLFPVHVGGGTAGYGTEWTIKWMRRSRFQWQWVDLSDVSADESSYNFEVRIYNNPDTPTTVTRTITVTGATVGSDGFFSTTYSNDDQITDFSVHQSRIAVSIRQVGGVRNSEWTDIVTLNSGLTLNTVLLLHMDGADGSTTFTDEKGKTVTANGNAQIDTAQSKFGTASGLFDGTTDYLSVPDSADFDFAAGDFTIEMFIRLNSVTGNHNIIAKYSTDATGPFAIYQVNDQIGLYLSSNGTSWDIANNLSFGTFSTATWYHLAATRRGNTFRVFKDGVLANTTTSSSTLRLNTGVLTIGANNSGGESFNGWMDELRLQKGLALYTAAFTPPSIAFTE